MTGAWVVAAAVLLALGFGLYRRVVDGRLRPATADDGLDPARIGHEFGHRATFVQFSSEVCAPCRTTARVLGEVSAATPGVAHVEIDAAQRLDLADELGITRTPTVLLLDSKGVVRNRIVGAPRKPDVLQALQLIDN
ncbi:MAG: thioredoxin family protein [Actinobacteria bacterium]|nr:thioredoxin family protein [Actinomycetota bacterium]